MKLLIILAFFSLPGVYPDFFGRESWRGALTQTAFNAQAVLYMVYGEKIPVDKELLVNCGGGSAKQESAKKEEVLLQSNKEKAAFVSKPIPNPLSNTATIQYYVPEEKQNAAINMYDLMGRLVKTYLINNKQQELIINAVDFANGIYIYTLQIDGAVIGKEKMVIIK